MLKLTGYLHYLNQQGTIEAQTRVENIEEFLSVTKNFDEKDEGARDALTGEVVEETGLERLSRFLNDLSLIADVDSYEESADSVTMMTLHAAKGLEFPVVFLIGLEEGIVPLSRANEDAEELEEERRLAYVGITRAEQILYLTNANSRVLYGKSSFNRPSRFISEIDDTLLTYAGQAHKRGTSFNVSYAGKDRPRFASGGSMTSAIQERKDRINPFAADNKEEKIPIDWEVGDTARHKKWGDGLVLAVSGSGKNKELTLNFPEVGKKRLLAAVAPIEKV
jgi:DNA helicase-2/ATP-dependent DNA helicase PcrA